MNPAPSDSLVGKLLADKYAIIREIGRGGMGVVYEAEHVQLGKRVAIKLMLEKYSDDTEAVARFQREALAASRIGNQHIIDVMDIGTAPDGRSFVVMELLARGQSLGQLLEEGRQIPMWRAVHIIRQVLRAVGAAHAKGIIHRDLKPDNIFLLELDDQKDFVKLLDFGISKVIDSDEAAAATKLTTTGVVIGTPLYMAPEQAMGNSVERFADIYACGVILYELLAGKPPFDGPNYAVLITKVLTADAPVLSDTRTGLPPKLVAAVHKALEKDPAKRFRTCEEFALALPSNKSQSQMELAGTMESGRRPSAPALSPNDLSAMSGNLSTLGSSAGSKVIPVAARVTQAGTPTRWPWLAGAGAAIIAGIVVAAISLGGKHASAPTVAAASPPPTMPGSAAVTNGVLSFETTPTGAMVTVDKTPRGPSPFDLTLTPGDHEITIEAPGFTTVTFQRQVQAGQLTKITLKLSDAGQKPAVPVATTSTPPPAPPAASATKHTKTTATVPKTTTVITVQSPPQIPPTTNPYVDDSDDATEPDDTDEAPPPTVEHHKKPKDGDGAKSNPYLKK